MTEPMFKRCAEVHQLLSFEALDSDIINEFNSMAFDEEACYLHATRFTVAARNKP